MATSIWIFPKVKREFVPSDVDEAEFSVQFTAPEATSVTAMAHAIRGAVEAGRLAHGAGRIPRRLHAEASSPAQGMADLTPPVE